MSTPSELQEVSVKLATLQGSLETGVATIHGQLAVLLERTDRTDADLKAVESRVTALERKVYGLAGVAALVGVSAPYVAQALAK